MTIISSHATYAPAILQQGQRALQTSANREAYVNSRAYKQTDPSSVNRAATSDTVQISDEAKQLSQSPPVTPTAEARTATFDENNPPLEAFASKFSFTLTVISEPLEAFALQVIT